MYALLEMVTDPFGYSAIACVCLAFIGLFILTISVDAFAIFHLTYILSAGFVGPAFMIVVSILLARVSKQRGWLSVAGFAIWVGCAGFAHLWVIAAASASV